MPQPLHHPELTTPPGWTRSPHLTQIRFLPPGEPPDAPTAAIYLSPLVGRHAQLPSMERLMAQAIEVEREARLTLTDFREPRPVTTQSGLHGICVELSCTVRDTQVKEQRVYVMYADAVCYYGLTYIAAPAVFATHLPAFWAVAGSLLPFKGRVVTPAAQAAKAVSHYDD